MKFVAKLGGVAEVNLSRKLILNRNGWRNQFATGILSTRTNRNGFRFYIDILARNGEMGNGK